MRVELIAHTEMPYDVIADAAGVCYSSEDIHEMMKNMSDTKRLNLIKKLEGSKHESPFEHVSFTFAISGISRACSHQLVRHRLASYSQRSQRYVNESGFGYVVPPEVKKNKQLLLYYDNCMDEISLNYEILKYNIAHQKIRKYWIDHGVEIEEFTGSTITIEEGIKITNEFKDENPALYNKIMKEAGEDARFVLPNACETQLVMTMNARSLWNFFNLRCCNRAQWEINELAWKMRDILVSKYPYLFIHSGPDCLNGDCKEGGKSCKHPYHMDTLYIDGEPYLTMCTDGIRAHNIEFKDGEDHGI